MTRSMPDLVAAVGQRDPAAVAQAERLLVERDLPENDRQADGATLRIALVNYYIQSDIGFAGTAGTGEWDYEKALHHLRHLAKSIPSDAMIALDFARMLGGTGRHAKSLSLLQRLRKAFGKHGLEHRILHAMARVHGFAGNRDAALDLYLQVLEQLQSQSAAAPSAEQRTAIAMAANLAARILVNRGEAEQALAVINRVPFVSEDPHLVRTRLRAEAIADRGLLSTRISSTPVKWSGIAVLCVKYGEKYGSDYVNRLYSMVRRNLRDDCPFFCLTDDGAGLHPDVRVLKLPENSVPGYWAKINIFDPDLELQRPYVFYLDLDTVVVGDLSFAEGPGIGFRIFESDMEPVFNSSVMLFERTLAARLFHEFTPDVMSRLHSDQDWIEECMPDLDTFSFDQVRAYRSLNPDLDVEGIQETDVRIVTFPTSPKPHQAKAPWVSHFWAETS